MAKPSNSVGIPRPKDTVKHQDVEDVTETMKTHVIEVIAKIDSYVSAELQARKAEIVWSRAAEARKTLIDRYRHETARIAAKYCAREGVLRTAFYELKH